MGLFSYGADGDAMGPCSAVEILRACLQAAKYNRLPLACRHGIPLIYGVGVCLPRVPPWGRRGEEWCRPSACRVQGGARSTLIKNTADLFCLLHRYKGAKAKWPYFPGVWAGLSGQAKPGRTGEAWPDWRSLAGYK